MVPAPRTAVARSNTRRGPQMSASQPTMGATAPSTKSDSAAAPESCWRVQPNSASIGLMKTPKTARSPEPPSMTNTTAASTIQP